VRYKKLKAIICLFLVILTSLIYSLPVYAHNNIVHRDMTDVAYEVMLAFSKFSPADVNSIDKSPEMQQFFKDIKAATLKLRSLPSGLPNPKASTCIDPTFAQMHGTNTPNWQTGGAFEGAFEAVPMGNVRYPISTSYISGNDCGIDVSWMPGPFYNEVNSGGLTSRDHTGVVLGFWTQAVDDELNDFHMWIRPSNILFLSVVKEYLEKALGVTLGTVWITVKCFTSCAASALTAGIVGDCKKCLDDAIKEAKSASHDVVTEIDGLAPGFGDITGSLYVGMGHHVNVSQAANSIVSDLKGNYNHYDDQPGMLTENAGPNGLPGNIEVLSMAGADLIGMSVHYDLSLGPKRYEVTEGNDFHPNSIDRSDDDWQYLSWPHIPFTPLDNLAWFGWKQFRDNPQSNAKYLGWPLHAIGDATVPMHVTGTFAHGHRPYEDAIENQRQELLYGDGSSALVRRRLRLIMSQALLWRKFILNWRAKHPANGADVPIRDLVTQLAQQTLSKVNQPNLITAGWPFNDLASTTYLLDKGLATGFYEAFPGVTNINQELLENGVAAEIAFLTSAAESVK